MQRLNVRAGWRTRLVDCHVPHWILKTVLLQILWVLCSRYPDLSETRSDCECLIIQILKVHTLRPLSQLNFLFSANTTVILLNQYLLPFPHLSNRWRGFIACFINSFASSRLALVASFHCLHVNFHTPCASTGTLLLLRINLQTATLMWKWKILICH
jgi:hypothetical protein